MRINVSPHAGFGCTLLFMLPFAAAGLVALFLAVDQFREGAPLGAVAMMGGMGLLFVGLSVFMVVQARRQAQRRTQEEQQRVLYQDRPWAQRPEWRTNRLRSTGREVHGIIVMAVLWNLLSWPLAIFATVSEAEDGKPIPWFVWLFPLIGIGLAAAAVRAVVHRRKFGETVFEMDAVPGRLGGTVSGWVETGLAARDEPAEGIRVRLTCYRRRVTRDADGDRDVDEDVLWSDEKRMRGQPYGTLPPRLRVPVHFEVPEDLPATTLENPNNRTLWRLELDAAVPGVDYDVQLEVPVYPADESAVPAPEEQAGERAAAVFWDLGDTAGRMQHTPQEAGEPASAQPYADYEIRHDRAAPTSPGITMQRTPSGGLVFHFARARNKGMVAITTLLFLAFLAGLIALVLAGASLLLILIIGLFVVVLGYAALHSWTYASTVTVAGGQIRVESGRFGRGQTAVVPCADLEDIVFEVGSRAGDTHYYDLYLVRRSEPSAAERAKRTAQMERAGSVLKMLGGDDKTVKQGLQKAYARNDRVKAATGLADKQEADWIAAQIRQHCQPRS